jgi:hypothetical protein
MYLAVIIIQRALLLLFFSASHYPGIEIGSVCLSLGPGPT